MTPLLAAAILAGANQIKDEAMALSPHQESLWRASLEKLGVAQVRSALDRDKIQPAYVHLTSQWLAEKDREAEAQERALELEQTEIAQATAAEAGRASAAAEKASVAADQQATAAERQAIATERANTRATIALIIAIISMIVTLIGIWLPHYWDMHK
jgi:hypothetical protein